MDSYYTSLLVHLSIAVERLISGQGTVDKEAYPESVLEYKEGEIASYIAQQIEETFHTRVPESERAYICIHLMGASLPDPARQDEMHSSRISSFTEHLVSFVEESVGIRFLQDDVLLTSLATHIKTSIFRIQSGMSRPIHYSTHIPAELEPLYHAVWAGNYYYRQVFNLNPHGRGDFICLFALRPLSPPPDRPLPGCVSLPVRHHPGRGDLPTSQRRL